MRVRRRSLRKALVAIGCLVGAVELPGLIAGALLLAAGSALHLWSKGCLEQNQRLVTSGPYRFSRNPFYLANLLIDLGICCVIGRIWIAVPFLVLWWLAYRETIRLEEVRLAALFPAEFERYAAAVPRLIPTGRSLPREESTGGFTLANPALAQGSEYARIVGVWLAAAAIVASEWIRARGLEVFAVENTAGLGLLALLPVAWVVKLALAELFRRPETALLPFADEPTKRRVVTFALVAALYLAARYADPSRHSMIASAAFMLMVAALAVLPHARDSHVRSALLHAGLALALSVFAASRDLLWCASLPLLWALLAALDDFARARSADLAADGGERRLWSSFAPIAIGASTALIVIGALRSFV